MKFINKFMNLKNFFHKKMKFYIQVIELKIEVNEKLKI